MIKRTRRQLLRARARHIPVSTNMIGSTVKVISDSLRSSENITTTIPISVRKSASVPTMAQVTRSCSVLTSEVSRDISTPTSARS